GTSTLFSHSALAIDLSTAYSKAVKYDSALAASRARLEAETEGEAQAKAGLLPQVSLGASASHQDIDSDNNNDDSYRTSGYSLSLSQPLFRAQNWYQYTTSQKNTQIAIAQFEKSQQDLILNVATAYFNVLRAQDNLTTAQSAEAAFKRQWEQAKERFDVGLIAITEVHEAKATYDASITARIQASSSVNIAFENLNRLTGERATDIATLAADFPVKQPEPTDTQAWIDRAIQDNLSVRASQYTLDTVKEQLRTEKAGHYPTLDLVASYDNSDTTGAALDDTKNNASIGLSFNLPLYQGGGTQASIRRARYLVEEARQNLETLRRNTQLDTSSLFLSVITDIQTVQSQKKLIVSRESALEATRAGYSVGTRNIVEVLDAERNYYSALRDYANARYDYVIDSLTLKQAAGSLNPQDINDLNRWLKSTN
ncbi:MAG: TolC family outer membrane protein, partial [Pseudomonadales bacterium]|nr:TolC family outer membrane protein [Pseudomonadales bacterium]